MKTSRRSEVPAYILAAERAEYARLRGGTNREKALAHGIPAPSAPVEPIDCDGSDLTFTF